MSGATAQPKASAPPPLYGLVLAGGRSKRMGRDKSAILYGDRPQVETTFQLLSPLCVQTFISNRSDQSCTPGHEGKPQLHDRYTDLGPLGGLLTAFDTHPSCAWLVIACDLPFLKRETLDHLIANRDPKCDATAFRSHHFEGLPEPLCAIYEPAMRARLQQFAADGITCPRKALVRSNTHLIDLPDPHALENANLPEEFEAARAALAAGSAVELNTASKKERQIRVCLYALLREKANRSELALTTTARTALDVYGELQQQFALPWEADRFRVAINDTFCSWDAAVRDGDCLHVIPPVAGG
ncbi:MAG: NTP transferase domain-containing protein [Kiritimatiellae bacterium]|nr:NTP transferase domain-containing protein [Kiritimatiellia bacterium]